MKRLVVSVAGLGWDDVGRHGLDGAGGLRFRPVESVFPAVTCVAQATLRTALPPSRHGMVSNGWFSRDLRRPAFWEQSSALVRGGRVWDGPRASGASVGMFFFQQSLGENVDFLLSPAHIHKHGGSSILYRYAVPAEMGAALEKERGSFPLWRYWGPLAHPKAGDAVLGDFLCAARRFDPDIAFVYLPTLDYDAQRFGPAHPRCARAAALLRSQLGSLAALAREKNADVAVVGEYAIAPVSAPPVFPNAALRAAGLFAARELSGMLYPDFQASRAFAMCDHETAHVYVRAPEDVAKVRAALAATGDYAEILEKSAGGDWASDTAGELLLVAREGSWCAYPWWESRREAPDFATHVDIHNKPGFDPCELFFDRGPWLHPRTCQDFSRVGGTHGRARPVAAASTGDALRGGSFTEIAAALPAWLS